jgi:SAM-dependent methyltransferase
MSARERFAVEDLVERYRGHPGAPRSRWLDIHADTISPDSFRSHGPYVWQDRHDRSAYERSYADLADRYESLAARATEDGAFGARCEWVDGKKVSRDLLDSVAEIGFIESFVGPLDAADVLDIGAGYGRLGHRLHELAPRGCRVRCVDGVPISTHICAHYLAFRGATSATTVALDEVSQSLADRPASIACNVHSFSEMPLAAIEWWLRLLVEHEVNTLFLVPNKMVLRSTEPDAANLPFHGLLGRYGFSLVHTALKYRGRRSSNDDSFVFQDEHMLFVRNR